MIINALLTHYLVEPIGLDSRHPQLSYSLRSDEDGARQSAYQIQVARDQIALESDAADLWDSGRVKEERPFGIRYAGENLQPRQRAFWRVRVWDQDERASQWSPVASWETGMLDESWDAPWIGAPAEIDHSIAPRFATEFDAPPVETIRSARARISGLGVFAASINGHALTDDLFEPGESDFSKTVYYATYDVLWALRSGRNALGVMVGNGQYVNFLVNPVMRLRNDDGSPGAESPRHRYQKDDGGYVRPGLYGEKRLIAQIELVLNDGTTRILAPAVEEWRVTPGPVTFNNWYGGEDFDGTLDVSGWDQPVTHRDDWLDAVAIAAPLGRLRGRDFHGARVVERFPAAAVSRLRNGNLLVDMGRNVAGFPEIVLTGTTNEDRGRTITMLPAEMIGEHGGVDQSSCTQSQSEEFHCEISNSYVVRGDGEERWHPVFCYQGFRYVEVRGFVGELRSDSFWCCVVRVANERTGSFATSSPSLDMIARLTDRSIESNMLFSFTDCPQIEKLGWLETSHLMLSSIAAGYDIRSWVPKIVRDMVDAQTTDDDHSAGDPEQAGYVPAIAPEYHRIVGLHRDPNWGGASILTPWEYYRAYGDTAVLRDAYPTMLGYLSHLKTHVQNDLLTDYAQMGDWGQINESTPTALVENCAYVRLLSTVATVAEILDHPAEALEYRDTARRTTAAIHNSPGLYQPDGVIYGNGSQASYGCALFSGIVTPENLARVRANLVRAVELRDGHLSSGEVGLKQVFASLAAAGRSDVVLRMVLNETAPSYTVFVRDGLTTLPEYWNYEETWRGMVRSRNHAMMGHVREWLTDYVLGVRSTSPGYRTAVIAPALPRTVPTASGGLLTPYGRIAADYALTESRFSMKLQIPAGVTADIALPQDEAALTAGWSGYAHPLTKWIRSVGSGNHHFQVGRTAT